MPQFGQVNVRAPLTAKADFQELARRMRNDPRVIEKFRNFLANEGAQRDEDLRETVDELKSRLFHLEAMFGVTKAGRQRITHEIERGKPDQQIAATVGCPVEVVAYLRRGIEAPEAPQTKDVSTELDTASDGEAWTVGTGQGKTLTQAGVVEVERRLREGDTPKAIAAAFGLSTNSVQYRKRKLRERGLVP